MEKLVDKQQKVLEEATRRHVFEAVVRVTQKGNTPDFTVQQVADEAGMAIGTLYNYFESKDTLLIYVFRQLFALNRERCDSVAFGPGRADQRLERLATMFFQFGREYIIIFRIFNRTGLHHHLPEEERERNANYDIERIRGILVEGIREGVFQEMNAHLMAKVFFACMIGSLIAQPFLSEFSPEQISKELMRLFDV